MPLPHGCRSFRPSAMAHQRSSRCSARFTHSKRQRPPETLRAADLRKSIGRWEKPASRNKRPVRPAIATQPISVWQSGKNQPEFTTLRVYSPMFARTLALCFQIGLCTILFVFMRLLVAAGCPIPDDTIMMSNTVSRMEEHRIKTNSLYTMKKLRHPVPKVQERFV